jgi:mycothiol synthase
MLASFVTSSANPDERETAFRLIFQQLSAEEREARVANALRLVEQRELNPDAVWVIRGQKQLLGAMVCLPVPGASALVWPPQVVAHTRRQNIEDQLLQAALSWLQLRGAKVAQALLAQDESTLAPSLLRNGFAHITRLWYLRHDLGFPAELLSDELTLDYQDYTHCDRDLFHQTLLRTYDGTLDCPEVNGVRELHEIIQGHQAQGAHDPRRWSLALKAGFPVGVLMLTSIPDWQGWDISYVGVVPEARRRGIGCELTRRAIRDAQAAGASQLTLAVDDRNRPARNLYERLGFEPFDQREVYLAIW